MARKFILAVASALTFAGISPTANATEIVASVVIGGGGPPSIYFSEINLDTGIASRISPNARPTLGGLAATRDSAFYASQSRQLFSVDVHNNTRSLIGNLGDDAEQIFSSLDIMSDGRAFTVVQGFGGKPSQLYSVDLQSAAITPVNQTGTIADAIIAAGDPLGKSNTIFSLGSVGKSLYAIDSNSGTLLSLNPDTGAVTVPGGHANQLRSGQLANGIPRSRYSDMLALTGVDTNGDGEFDSLFGGVNRFDDDGDPNTPDVNIGGVAKFDLSTGQWELVGTNPGVAFIGFASVPVPEPSGMLTGSLGLSMLIASASKLRRR